MRVRLNLPTTLVYCTLSYLVWFLLPPLLRAAVYIRSFALRLLLQHLMLCVCLCRRLAFMLVILLLFSPRTYGFPRTSTYDDEQKKEGGTK